MMTSSQFDILDEKFVKVDERYVLNFSNEIINNDAKLNCKVLKFTSEWKLDDVLLSISDLSHVEYPNLFIFVINNENFEFYKGNIVQKMLTRKKLHERIRKSLNKFENRLLILQLTSESENATKFYFHEEKSGLFTSIKKQDKSFVKVSNFTTFIYSFLNGQYKNFEDVLVHKLPKITHSDIILRFIRIFKLSDEFFIKIIFKCAAHGTIKDFLASLDAPFDSKGRILTFKSQKYLTNLIDEDSDEINAINPLNNHDTSMASLRDYEDHSLSSYSSSICHLNSSVLLTAIEGKNKEVVDFLISYCTHLIQELPYEHQVKISTTAFDLNQHDILCDLLEFSDFPFPQDFESKTTDCKRLVKIVADRNNLKDAILSENFQVITNFINSNPNLKVIYSQCNKSALSEAIAAKKFIVYFYLKSFGFHATEFDSHEEVLSGEDLMTANKHFYDQKLSKGNEILNDVNNTVSLLLARSFINNRKVSKAQEAEYRQKIKKWIEDINKIKFGKIMLDIAASCESLKIIFDFESVWEQNSSMKSLTHPTNFIIIPAKSSPSSNDQDIKGILARELCHHVINMIFENNGNPYYKHSVEIIKSFEFILKASDKWSLNNSEFTDNECDGIISSAYKSRKSEHFHGELIDSVMQILVKYGDDEQKLNRVLENFEGVFGFFKSYVCPEMIRFSLRSRNFAKKFNGIAGFLDEIAGLNFEVICSKDVKILMKSKLAIVTTNVPKFFFIDIYKHLLIQFGDFINAQNIFIKSETLKNSNPEDNFEQQLSNFSNLNIFVDCSKEVIETLPKIINEASNYIFIVSNTLQKEELLKIISKYPQNVKNLDITYNWNDLTFNTQQQLLQRTVNFQNNSNISLIEVLSKNADPLTDKSLTNEQKEKNFKHFSEIIDDNLLNMLVEDETILINTKFTSDYVDKFLYQARNFIKDPETESKLSLKDLLMDVKEDKFVLISDIAGAGKSWILKDLLMVLSTSKWMNYVDLRMLNMLDKSQCTDFISFMSNNLLKSMSIFEKNLFQFLYKIGKVTILFDGIDELSPDSIDFIISMLARFDSNEGNQLWIAARNHLEIQLQSKLNIEKIYRLDDFKDNNAIDFIVSSWILLEVKETGDAENCLRQNFNNYCESAQILVEKALTLKPSTIGLPQLYCMIADIFKSNVNAELNLKESKIYRRYTERIYEAWTSTKDENSLEMCLNFWNFHEIAAIENLLPEYSKLCIDTNGSAWSDEEVNNCGLMIKTGNQYVFKHLTIAEYLIANFIAKLFKKPKINDQAVELIVHVLTTNKFRNVMMFLNDIIDDWDKIQEKLLKNRDQFYKIETFSDIFIHNLENIGSMIINIFRNGDYTAVSRLIFKNAKNIAIYTKNPKIFVKFQEFMLQFLKVSDIKKLVYREDIAHVILQTSQNIEDFESFITKLSVKASPNFTQEILEKKSAYGNVFDILGRTENLHPQKFQKCLSIMLKLFNNSQVFQFMEDVNSQKQNILHVCIQTGSLESLRILWTDIEKFCASQKLLKLFKKLVMQKANDDLNVLHFAARNEIFEFHETFWGLLSGTFKNREELKNFMLQMDNNGNNFVHFLVLSNNNPAIIDLTLKMLDQQFVEVQLKQILKSKGEHKRNLLHAAACMPKSLEIHQILWTYFKTLTISNQEFSKILFELDDENENILSTAAHFSSADVFDFMIKELEKITLRDQIKKMLNNMNSKSRNLLQIAAYDNNDKNFHECLLKILFKYFKQTEILDIIKHVDDDGMNFFSIAVHRNSKEVVEAVWENIKVLLSKEAQFEYLKIESHGVDIVKMSLNNKRHPNVHEYVQKLMDGYAE